MLRLVPLLPLLLAASWLNAQAVAQPPPPPDPARWESAIEEFEARDAVEPPAQGGIVFAGSSSIRLWTSLAEDFPAKEVLNRGFGGSQLPEVIAFASRIIIPYRPRQVVVYCGANDIAGGRTPGQVIADFRTLVATIHAALPATRVSFISIAPNPARWEQLDRIEAANAGIARWAQADPLVDYVDVFTHMLGADGLPKPDIYVEDRLHMNEKGYAIWVRVVGPFLR